MRFIVLVMLIGWASDTAIFAQEGVKLRAGTAAVDVSPTQFPINMPGGFGPNPATKVNDPLHARAIVLDDGTTRVALVLVDNLGIAKEVIEEAKAIVKTRTGIPPEQVLISSTHTHSGPPSNTIEGPAPAVAYRKLLITGIADAITKANDSLRPAAVGMAAHPLPDEVFNRRWFLKPGKMPLNPFGATDLVKMNPGTGPDVLSHPAGPTDPDVTVLSVQDAMTRKPLAIYANYSLHYVGGTPRAAVSADYFGEFARLMPVRVGANPDGSDGFVAMLTNGTSGDINNIPFNTALPRPPREPMEQIRQVAGKTADAAYHARTKIGLHRSDMRIQMRHRNITLQSRRPTAEQIARAEEIVKLKDPAEIAKLPALAVPYAERTLALAKSTETITVTVQAVAIGDVAICALPFEVFVEIGLDLKKRSPFSKTMVVSIANGYHGYLPTPEQHALGGYETWMGTNRVQLDASTILSNQLLEMLGEMMKK